MHAQALPGIIQGGMGIGISDWRLARAVSRCGELGVVSGTAIDSVLVRRLQDGDPGGHMQRAMGHFPLSQAAEQLMRRFFIPGGRSPAEPYSLLPMHQQVSSRLRQQITMLASFVEVFLAKEGHEGRVGLNLLTKVQLPNLASLYGAMLAGVNDVLMGAGIPREIPGVLDALARHEPVSLRLEVEDDASGVTELVTFDPREHLEHPSEDLQRPRFLPIIASHSLATMLARKSTGRIDGFIVEGPSAGGHNAPPRGEMLLNPRGEPRYGERDVVDLAKVRELGLPFWLAGGWMRDGSVREAQAMGAAGVQVGTLFAYCDESGLAEPLKRSVLEHSARGSVDVLTDPVASPTGYPFKVVEWPGDPAPGQARERVCDLGYLRVAYRRPDGRIGYRCASEPVDQYVEKGGREADTVGRRCLCNALFANIGMAQVRDDGRLEPPLLTSGDDLRSIGGFLSGRTHYTAADVVAFLRNQQPGSTPPTTGS